MVKRAVSMVLFACVLFVSGCSSPKTLPDEKITDVVRIFVHDPMRYSVMVQESQNSEIKLVTLGDYGSRAKFFVDVSTNESMWVLIHRTSDAFGEEHTSFDFHIHSQKDVEGAGWNHGKGGHGQTIVIE